jgi:hypothetical protein
MRTTEDGVLEGPFMPGNRVDIAMPGFLRRVTAASTDDVTLWPVANDMEAAAIRSMLYEWYDPVPLQHSVSTLAIVLDARIVAARPDAAGIWRDAASQVTDLTEGRIRFVDSGESAAGRITIQISPCSPLSVCQTPPYYSGSSDDRRDVTFEIDSTESAARPDVALRACVLSAINFTDHNPLPGLLAWPNPAPMLSDFERRLIRMATLRRSGTTWPDNDF